MLIYCYTVKILTTRTVTFIVSVIQSKMGFRPIPLEFVQKKLAERRFKSIRLDIYIHTYMYINWFRYTFLYYFIPSISLSLSYGMEKMAVLVNFPVTFRIEKS